MGEIHNAKDVVLWFLGSRKREARISRMGENYWEMVSGTGALGTPPFLKAFCDSRFGILDDTLLFCRCVDGYPHVPDWRLKHCHCRK